MQAAFEKIIEKLENASFWTDSSFDEDGNCNDDSEEAVYLHEAIEIVKQGGVSDDVCEWKSVRNGEFIQNPHTKRLYSNEPSMRNVYCNTCGKKIKIVGD